MNFTIEIKADSLVQAINNLAGALSGAQLHTGQALEGIGEEKPKVETKKEVTPVKEEPKKETKQETPKEEPKKEEPKNEAAPEISLEVVRGKLADYASQGKDKQVEVMEALSRFGVKKLTDVKPEDYKELLSLLGLTA